MPAPLITPPPNAGAALSRHSHLDDRQRLQAIRQQGLFLSVNPHIAYAHAGYSLRMVADDVALPKSQPEGKRHDLAPPPISASRRGRRRVAGPAAERRRSGLPKPPDH